MKGIDLDNKGQLSLEYILSSMVIILMISLISVPILLTTIDYTSDIIDSINSKNELHKITDAIDCCYFSGKGSKRIVHVDFNRNVNIRIFNEGNKGIASVNLNLSDGPKEINDSFDCSNLNENIHLSQGFAKISVEWDEKSNKIEVSKLI